MTTTNSFSTRPKALLFDLDGTLVDSEAAICDSAAAAFLDLGKKVQPADIADHLGAPLVELFQLFYLDEDPASGGEALLLDPTYQRYLQAFLRLHEAHPDAKPSPLPHVLETLAALVDFNLPMAVATTKPTHRALHHIEGALAPFFAHVQGTDPGLAPKPAPDVLIAACEGIGVDVKDVWMIGDTQRDISAAKNAGARSVAVAYSDERFEQAQLFGADVVLWSLKDLPLMLHNTSVP